MCTNDGSFNPIFIRLIVSIWHANYGFLVTKDTTISNRNQNLHF
jgi:hypothetical protein